jgi:glycosyltransferase involved in cell wall biosynthesis
LNQTYDDFELIIVDDHSQDRTPDVLEAYEAQYDRVRVIRHETNKGPGAAFNTGKRAANGEFVAFLDDDDEWRPEKLERQVAKMKDIGESYGLVTGGVTRIDNETGDVVKRFVPSLEGNVFYKILDEGSSSVLGPPSVILLRKSAMNEIGEFREDMPRGCGQEYYCRLARHYKVSYVEEMCLNYYVHSDRITPYDTRADIENGIEALSMMLAEFADDLLEVPTAYQRETKRLGHFHCLNGDTSTGRSYLYKALKANGFDLTLFFQYLSSFLGARGYRSLYYWYVDDPAVSRSIFD